MYSTIKKTKKKKERWYQMNVKNFIIDDFIKELSNDDLLHICALIQKERQKRENEAKRQKKNEVRTLLEQIKEICSHYNIKLISSEYIEETEEVDVDWLEVLG